MTTQVVDPRTRDEVAIRQLVADTVEFQSDTDRFTALLTEDVVLVNLVGIRVIGREALRKAMSRALETPLANVLTEAEVLDITFARPDVAIVSCLKRVHDGNSDRSDSLASTASLTFTVLDEGDAWRIALAQTTPIHIQPVDQARFDDSDSLPGAGAQTVPDQT
jgi:uncharacterized protein (TIGR02246 family)